MTDEGESLRNGIAGERGARAGGAGSKSAQSAAELDEQLRSRLLPLRQSPFSGGIDKILIYVQSAAKSKDQKTLANFIRFARLNLETVMVQAQESMVFRPRLASKSDEQKRAAALQKAFDRMDRPEKALLEHYAASSDPLNKYLVAGPWGHQYLMKRGVEAEALEAFNEELCELLGCGETAAGKIVLAYAGLSRDLDRLRDGWPQSLAGAGPGRASLEG